MDVGEVYLVLLRPSRVPVAGEALCNGFQGQVELHDWRWCLQNAQELKRAEESDARYRKRESRLVSDRSKATREAHAWEDFRRDHQKALDDLRKEAAELGAGHDVSPERRAEVIKSVVDRTSRQLTEIQRGAPWKKHKESEEYQTQKQERLAQSARDGEIQEAERNKNFQFRFRKRVDLATTQLLNSMKLGDVFSSGTLTIHQRSVNSGMTLVLNLQKVRLLEYGVSVQVSETMTDMIETWTAEFDAMSYVYKNRNAIGSSTNALQAGMKAATQGTVRTFAMHNVSLSI